VKVWESQFAELKTAAGLAGGAVAVHVHVTGNMGDEEKGLDTSSTDKEDIEDGRDVPGGILMARGRPNIPAIVAEKGKTWTGHVGAAGEF